MSTFLHEQIYRDIASIAHRLVVVCGLGALGANLVESLARMGMKNIRGIDFDKVQPHNLSNQPYMRQHVGMFKQRALADHLYRAVDLKLDTPGGRLGESNVATLLKGTDVIVDAFDDPPSRMIVAMYAKSMGVPCLHVATSEDGRYGCGLWDDRYRIPERYIKRTQVGCEYPFTRPLALIVANAGAESIVRNLAHGERKQFEFTLGDMRMS